MKKTLNLVLAIFLTVLMCLGVCACGNKEETPSVWENALYCEDKEFGDGAKNLTVTVKAEEKSVTFTVKTDKKTVGDALLEHDLIAGEEGAYGLYIKSVNGITADYDTDKSYWAFYTDGEYAVSGVDMTEIDEGVKYSLEYTKE